MSGARIRRATVADVEALVAIKRALPLATRPGAAARGGFLLGCSPEQYRVLVEHALVRVLETRAGAVSGFAIGLPDALLRRSEVWSRRAAVAWEDALAERVEREPVAYFDQLAVLPASRLHAPALAYALLAELRAGGHRHLFATVVAEPVRNPASLPILRAAGARRVGSIEERYEGVGRILSDVYYADTELAHRAVCGSPAGRRVQRLASAALIPSR